MAEDGLLEAGWEIWHVGRACAYSRVMPSYHTGVFLTLLEAARGCSCVSATPKQGSDKDVQTDRPLW